MRQALRKSLVWTVVLSETSHIFCCVLPTLLSLFGLLAGLGMAVSLPAPMVELHDILHRWEVPMIIGSGAILALGWAAIYYADRVDCHSTGCAHGACAPRKDRAHLVLKIATVLFVANVLIYALVHRTDWFKNSAAGHALFHENGENHDGHVHAGE